MSKKPIRLDVTKEWCMRMATAEEGHDISAGRLAELPAPVATPPVPTDVDDVAMELVEQVFAGDNFPYLEHAKSRARLAVRRALSRLAAVSPQPAADLRALVVRWRERAALRERDGYDDLGAAHDMCADDLEAALASAPEGARHAE